MTTSPILPRRARIAALLLCLAPFVHAQSEPEAAEPLIVQDVTCAGNSATSCDFIRGHLYLHAGQPLDEEEIRNAELRLSSSRSFRTVKIRLEKGARRGAVVVVIEVEEASPISTEWLLGASLKSESERGTFATRIGHQNLFGAGKVADFTATAIVPVAGESSLEAYGVLLRYADPQLFGSSRWFGIASAGWRRVRGEDIYGNYNNLETAQADLRLGLRFGDFSYVTLGVRYRPNLEWTWGRWESDGSFVTEDAHPNQLNPSIAYGWSSEDDLRFPTQGSSLQLAAGSDGPPLQFRKTWSPGAGFLTFKFGGDPSPDYRTSLGENLLLSLSYARSVAPGDEIQRGRWYVEPGIGAVGYSSGGDSVFEYGIKAGFRAETRTFGLIDLYVIGRVDTKL